MNERTRCVVSELLATAKMLISSTSPEVRAAGALLAHRVLAILSGGGELFRFAGDEKSFAQQAVQLAREAQALAAASAKTVDLPCQCGCGKLVPGGLMEIAHPDDYRYEDS